MKNRIKTLFVRTLSLVLIFGVVTGSSGTVLCIGADDHVEVESVCQPFCASDKNSSQAVYEDPLPTDHEECSECTDIAISLGILRYGHSPLIAGLQIQSSFLPVLSTVSSRYECSITSSRSPLPGSQTPISASFSEHLATTVIRC